MEGLHDKNDIFQMGFKGVTDIAGRIRSLWKYFVHSTQNKNPRNFYEAGV